MKTVYYLKPIKVNAIFNGEGVMDEFEKGEERNMFLFLTVVLFPVLSVAVVGAYGFAVWISQLLMGPPGA
ncbi:hypothetical protein GCM10007876_03000 [Litoribrevibacter albus]|uniref:Periplasmic nitrate reductase, NapE protein n=1 Tax=Litoribrevibacter albus TaxID=1473156 RepID=A0AA37S7T3_9GAMM|nr:hypothetical protein GCM10007876_03000 [Litoribrevibacter albus]